MIPKEDNNYTVYSSTQHPSETQQIIAKMLNQKSNSIDVLVRRIGGGFGGKETNFMTSAICALLSHKTKKPIKLRLDRDDDIIITGKRHDFYSDYEVGFDDDGCINGLKLKLASRCGMSPDLSLAINERALLHIDNAYYLTDLEIKNYLEILNSRSKLLSVIKDELSEIKKEFSKIKSSIFPKCLIAIALRGTFLKYIEVF